MYKVVRDVIKVLSNRSRRFSKKLKFFDSLSIFNKP